MKKRGKDGIIRKVGRKRWRRINGSEGWNNQEGWKEEMRRINGLEGWNNQEGWNEEMEKNKWVGRME